MDDMETEVNIARSDGRDLAQFRQNLSFKVGLLKQSSGSAYVEFGSTKVSVAVHGPRQGERRSNFSAQGSLNVTVTIAPFSGAPTSKRGYEAQSVALAHNVREAMKSTVLLDRYPKAIVDIHCLVLEDEGSVASALVTAASLAMSDAGVECRCLLSAACIVVIGNQLLLDPTREEEAASQATVIVAMEPIRQRVAHIDIQGSFDLLNLRDALGLSMSACEAYRPLLRDALLTVSGA